MRPPERSRYPPRPGTTPARSPEHRAREVGRHLSRHQVAGAHPAPSGPLAERDPGARLPARRREHLHPLERLHHAPGRERFGPLERGDERLADVVAVDRHDVFGSATVDLGEAVEEALPHLVALVVLLEADPAEMGTEDLVVHVAVLPRRPHEPRRVPAERGQRVVHPHHAQAEPPVHDRVGRARVHRADDLRRVDAALRDRRLAHDADAFDPARLAERRQVLLADQRTLMTHRDGREAALTEDAGDHVGLVGQRAVPEREGPLTVPLVGTAPADGRHLEPVLDRLAQRHRALRDHRPEHAEAPFVDQLAVGVDHRLDRAAGQALALPDHELHRTVEPPGRDRVVEREAGRLEEVVADVPGRRSREHEVDQHPDLDRCDLVGDSHDVPLGATALKGLHLSCAATARWGKDDA